MTGPKLVSSSPECVEIVRRRLGRDYKVTTWDSDCRSVTVAFVISSRYGTRLADVIKYRDGLCAVTIGNNDTEFMSVSDAIRRILVSRIVRLRKKSPVLTVIG